MHAAHTCHPSDRSWVLSLACTFHCCARSVAKQHTVEIAEAALAAQKKRKIADLGAAQQEEAELAKEKCARVANEERYAPTLGLLTGKLAYHKQVLAGTLEPIGVKPGSVGPNLPAIRVSALGLARAFTVLRRAQTKVAGVSTIPAASIVESGIMEHESALKDYKMICDYSELLAPCVCRAGCCACHPCPHCAHILPLSYIVRCRS